MNNKIKVLALISSGVVLYYTSKYIYSLFNGLYYKEKHKIIKSSEALLREQLKRNYEFFKEEGMKLIRKSYIVIVGLNAIGSSCALTLIRSGIRKVRLIDDSILTHETLQYHPYAVPSDVNKYNTDIIEYYAYEINPNVIIEKVNKQFCLHKGNEMLMISKDKPDYILDCIINNIDQKCELIKYAYNNKIKVITIIPPYENVYDPTLIRINQFTHAESDLSKKMNSIYQSKFNESFPDIQTVYYKKSGDIEKGNNELSAMNSIYAMYSQIMTSKVLRDISKVEEEQREKDKNAKKVFIKGLPIEKLIKDYKNAEIQVYKSKAEEIKKITHEDYIKIISVFDNKSALDLKYSHKMQFARWRPYNPISPYNIILLSQSELQKHKTIKNEGELIKVYTKDIVDKIDGKLNSLKQNVFN